MMSRYQTFARLNDLPPSESFLLLTPACLLPFLAVGGALAFVIHYSILLRKEFAGRD